MDRNLQSIKDDLLHLEFGQDKLDSVERLIDLGSEAYTHPIVSASSLREKFKNHGRDIENIVDWKDNPNSTETFNSAKGKFISMICEVGYPNVT